MTPAAHNVIIDHTDQFEDIIHIDRAMVPTKTFFGDHVCTDYSVLPNSQATARAKDFLENLHTIGYIGSYSSFQNIFDRLSARQIVANMLFTADGIAHIRTVQLTPDILSIKQLQESYIFTSALIFDLNNMYSIEECNQDQINVLYEALNRLAFLKNAFKSELASLNAFDKTLDIVIKD